MTRESKQNIIILSIVGVLFIIGIIVRWDYVSSEIVDSFSHYIDLFDSAPQSTPTK